MPNNWKKYKLGEVCNRIYSGGTPSTTNKNYWNGDIPWLSSGETNNRYISHTDKFITKSGLEGSSARMAHKGSTVIASAGQGKTRGQTSFLMLNTSINQSVICLEANKEIVDEKFLFFNLSNRYDQFRMISDSYSTRGSLTTDLLKTQIELSLPPLPEQQAIAEILSALDDKIELNLKMNKTLEDMSNALYRNWFIDFGPFKDSKFAESELGMIPEGWEVKSLDQLCDMKYGTMPKSEKIQGSGYAIFSGYKIVGYYPEYNCEKGDIIVVARGVGGTGDVKRTPEKCFLTNLSISLKPKQNIIDRKILFYSLKKNGLDHLRTGSAQPQITINDLNSVVVLNPPIDIQSKFLVFFDELLDALDNNISENNSLKQARDYLSPKLISGEIRVKDTANAVREIT